MTTRKYTNALLAAIEDGMFEPKHILCLALDAMSEDDVKAMCEANELDEALGINDGEDNELNFEDDGQPDEAQEWHDFDPDC